ncbi:MAG: methionyl-tRNA formyltransferase [Candidatus Spechtbacterales bacterium]
MNIVFFGTPEFAKIILERLIQKGYKPISVVTQPDQPVGRKQIMTPPPVKVLAEQKKIPVMQPEKLDKAVIRKLQTTNYQLAIVAAYGKIIPKKILGIPKYGALNVHPSLLPRWRGPSPIQYAILNGDKETGVTIMLMDEEIDHGDIVSSIRYQVSREETAGELSQKLAEIGADLLIDTIPKWVAGEIQPEAQDHKKASYSKILTKEDGHIDWAKSAEEIECQIRAFTPWPGSFTFWNNKRLNIVNGNVSSLPLSQQLPPGQTFITQNRQLAVQTGSGIFVIDRVQLGGKNEITSREFLLGHKEIPFLT